MASVVIDTLKRMCFSAFGFLGTSRVPTPRQARNTFTPTRGILEQIIIPVIDESDDMQMLALRKFVAGLESSIGRRGDFSVCCLDDFLDELSIPMTPATEKSYNVLCKLHCVDFSILPPRLYEKLPHLINHVLSGGQIVHPLIGDEAVIDA